MSKRKITSYRKKELVYLFPTKLYDFIEWLEEQGKYIPKQYRNEAYITINNEELEISFLRLETDGEEKKRINTSILQQKKKEERDKSLFVKLKKKYNE